MRDWDGECGVAEREGGPEEVGIFGEMKVRIFFKG